MAKIKPRRKVSKVKKSTKRNSSKKITTKRTKLRRKRRRNSSEKRDVSKVPFLELRNGRLQGVVSSASDEDRIFATYIDQNGNYYCFTNNNRPCGGMKGAPCKHLIEMTEEAFKANGKEKVIYYLMGEDIRPNEIENAKVLIDELSSKGGPNNMNEIGSTIFSRYLDYLKYLNVKPTTMPISELGWFRSRKGLRELIEDDLE